MSQVFLFHVGVQAFPSCISKYSGSGKHSELLIYGASLREALAASELSKREVALLLDQNPFLKVHGSLAAWCVCVSLESSLEHLTFFLSKVCFWANKSRAVCNICRSSDFFFSSGGADTRDCYHAGVSPGSKGYSAISQKVERLILAHLGLQKIQFVPFLQLCQIFFNVCVNYCCILKYILSTLSLSGQFVIHRGLGTAGQ